MCAQDDEPNRARPDRPCPFCGQRLVADSPRCPRCKLAQDDKTVRALERVMGPWFIMDEANLSAPGVNWDKLLSLLERGKVGPDTIVRGPGTGGLWKLARQAPSVATQLGMCWSCQAALGDVTQQRCDRCGAATNGPTHWPGADKAPSPPPQPEDSSLRDLARATSAATANSRPAPPVPAGGSPSRSPALTLAVFVFVAAVCGTLFWAVLEHFRGPGRGTPVTAREPADTSPPVARRAGDEAEPRGPVPDMFPEVKPYRLVEQAASSPSAVSRAPEPAPIASPPVPPPPPPTGPGTRPAPRPDPLARQRRAALAALDQARKARDAGDWRQAEVILVNLLNTQPKQVWPEGAEETLKDVQDRLRATTQAVAAQEPLPPDIERQRAGAQALYDQALAFEKDGRLAQAQEALLKVLNLHHRAAWPDGALEAYRRVQQAIKQPTSAPKFFGVEGKK